MTDEVTETETDEGYVVELPYDAVEERRIDDRKTDSRGRVRLGTEYKNKVVDVLVLSVRDE